MFGLMVPLRMGTLFIVVASKAGAVGAAAGQLFELVLIYGRYPCSWPPSASAGPLPGVLLEPTEDNTPASLCPAEESSADKQNRSEATPIGPMGTARG